VCVFDNTYYKITTTNYISKTSLYTTFCMYPWGPWPLKILMFALLVTLEIATYSWPWEKTGDSKYIFISKSWGCPPRGPSMPFLDSDTCAEGGYLFCEGFLPCMMPSMDGWRDGWMDGKLHEKRPQRPLLHVMGTIKPCKNFILIPLNNFPWCSMAIVLKIWIFIVCIANKHASILYSHYIYPILSTLLLEKPLPYNILQLCNLIFPLLHPQPHLIFNTWLRHIIMGPWLTSQKMTNVVSYGYKKFVSFHKLPPQQNTQQLFYCLVHWLVNLGKQ
jgi:hypothetical protein